MKINQHRVDSVEESVRTVLLQCTVAQLTPLVKHIDATSRINTKGLLIEFLMQHQAHESLDKVNAQARRRREKQSSAFPAASFLNNKHSHKSIRHLASLREMQAVDGQYGSLRPLILMEEMGERALGTWDELDCARHNGSASFEAFAR